MSARAGLITKTLLVRAIEHQPVRASPDFIVAFLLPKPQMGEPSTRGPY